MTELPSESIQKPRELPVEIVGGRLLAPAAETGDLFV